MQLRIKSFKTHKTALTMAGLFSILMLFTLLPIMLMMSKFVTVQDGKVNQIPVVIIISLILSFLYFFVAYFGVIFVSWLYNQVAKKTGGIVINVEQLDLVVNESLSASSAESSESDLGKRES